MSLFRLSQLKPAASSLFLRPLTRLLSNSVKLTDYGIRDDQRDLLHIETRNMCKCETCFGRHSHQKTGLPSPGNLYQGVQVTEVGRVSEHYVSLKWSDGHEGLVSRTVRGEYGPEPVTTVLANYLELTMRQNKCQQFWSTENKENAKLFDYNTVISSVKYTQEFFAHYMTHGIALLTGIPENRDLRDIINKDLKCGPIRETVFGDVDVVRLKKDPGTAGYGRGSLAGHTDLNFYYQVPHVEFFYCLQNTVTGGDSFWVDTFSAVKELKEERPDYFNILTRVPVYHRFTPPGTRRYLRSHNTLISMLGDNIQQVNDNPWSIDTSHCSTVLDMDTRKLWWDAYLYYRGKVEDETRWITRKLVGGEIVITDNWRVLHGRKEFYKTEEQERVVATTYLDWNHVQRVMLSPHESSPCFLEIDLH